MGLAPGWIRSAAEAKLSIDVPVAAAPCKVSPSTTLDGGVAPEKSTVAPAPPGPLRPSWSRITVPLLSAGARASGGWTHGILAQS